MIFIIIIISIADITLIQFLMIILVIVIDIIDSGIHQYLYGFIQHLGCSLIRYAGIS